MFSKIELKIFLINNKINSLKKLIPDMLQKTIKK